MDNRPYGSRKIIVEGRLVKKCRTGGN